MRYVLALLMLAACVQCPPRAQDILRAPEKPVEVVPTKERPFLKDPPALPAAFEKVASAVKGDEDAMAEIKGAGLSYYGVLLNPQAGGDRKLLDGARELAFQLARENKEWIEEMCRWEATLLRPDPATVWNEYKRLKPRFMNAQTQLVRVMFHARLLGDMAAYENAAKSSPNSKWVKAARAWFLDGVEPKDAIPVLLGVGEESTQLTFSELDLYHSQMAESKRPHYWSEQGFRADFAKFEKPESIRTLLPLPRQFSAFALYERIGALATETDDKAFIAELVEQQRKQLADKPMGAMRLEALQLAATAEQMPLAANTQTRWRAVAKVSHGPELAGYAIGVLGGSQLEERIACGITAFMSQPDLTLAQRFCLTSCMGSWDDLLCVLAMRAVIALCPDSLGAWRNIARTLMRFNRLGDRREKLRAALAASKVEELVQLSTVMEKGKWEDLNPKVRKQLALSPTQQAALLAAFVVEKELNTYGGIEPVYWLNRAVFLNASRSVLAAAQCFFACLKATPEPKEQDVPQPAFLEYAQFLEANCDAAALESFDTAFKTFDEKTAAKAARQRQAMLLSSHPLGGALKQLRSSRVSLDAATMKALQEHPEQFGGAGLAAAAAGAFAEQKFTLRKTLRTEAEQRSPLSYSVHWLQCPFGETAATSSLCNWELCARATMRAFLLRPFALRSISMLLSVEMVSGQFGYACASALTVALGRQPEKLSPSSDEVHLIYAPSANRCVWPALHAACVYSGSTAEDVPRRASLLTTLVIAAFGTNTFERLMWQNMAGANPQFARSMLEELIGRRNMEDVDTLLDIARNIARPSPEMAITYVEKADQLGVSRYGRFVGTQSLMQAHAQLGTLDKVLERFHDMRADKRTGYPAYLDMFLLAGLLYGNNHKQAPMALEAIAGYEPDMGLFDNAFLWRAALMMSGRYDEIENIVVPQAPQSPAYLDAAEYSLLFHEAPALLAKASFNEILSRCEPYLGCKCENGVGVFLDAALLRAIALKASGQSVGYDAKKKTLAVVSGEFCDFIDGGPGLLDGHVAEILCGRREVGTLGVQGQDGYWHGFFFGERTPAYMGGGRASNAVILARDPFIRGVLAWLAGDDTAAREQLEACVKADQRNAHEYHVAKWLLAGPLKK
ncbi:hypothetical protein PLCT2_02906 [Planctomycetaceae bacterium]|nr:hypothetical protein PLCT2_02906 [Planctomycetaceae bacterium]